MVHSLVHTNLTTSTAFQIATAAVAGLIAGVVLVVLPTPVWGVLAMGGVIGAALLMRHLEWAFWGIVLVTSTILDSNTLPMVPSPVGALHLPELIMGLLFAVLLIRWLVDPSFVAWHSTPLNGPLLALFIVVLVSAGWSILETDNERHNTVREFRILFYMFTSVLVMNVIRSQAQLSRLLRGLVWMATIVAALMIAQAFAGTSVEIIPRAIVSVDRTEQIEAGMFRVTPPGQALVRTVLCFMMCQWLLADYGWAWYGSLSLIVIGLLVTLNRNYWAGSLVSIGLALLLVHPQARWQALRKILRAAGIGTICLIFCALVLAVLEKPYVQDLADSLTERLNPNASEGNMLLTLESRSEEVPYALALIKNHPFWGIGLGANYRPATLFSLPEMQSYTHNAYLWIMLKTGIAGLLAFGWVSAVFLYRTLTRWHTLSDRHLQAVVLGAGTLYAGLLVSAPFSPIFLEGFWTPLIGIVMGLSEAALALGRTGES